MKLRRGGALALLVLAGCLGAAPLRAQQEPVAGDAPPPRPTNPALFDVPDTPGLPRVLIIGDSISMGYMLPVRARLRGVANVHHPPENCGSTQRGLDRLDLWLGHGHWDVIHFNFGLHDLKYLDSQGRYVPPDQGKQVASPEVYAQNLRRLVARLKRTGARLIFATTTPVPAGSLGRVTGDEVRYNQAAVQVMREEGIAIDDLEAYVVPRQAAIQRPHNVHFTAAGYEQLAALVAASIRTALPPPIRSPL